MNSQLAQHFFHTTCYFCGKRDADNNCCAIFLIRWQRTKYDPANTLAKVLVPRCQKCKPVHDLAENIGFYSAWVAFISLSILIFIPIYTDWVPFEGYIKFQESMGSDNLPWYAKIIIILSPFWVSIALWKISPRVVSEAVSSKIKILNDGINYPAAIEAWKEIGKTYNGAKRMVLSNAKDK